ncbi:MAG: hypothetical protein HOG49_16750 [Candidatus Scalindua sp.]|jgi:hypothetical protein|nr:hypothetical protein [Candidatus Scalindua sp.]
MTLKKKKIDFKLDLGYVKSGLIFMGFLVSAYIYLTQTVDIEAKKSEINNLVTSLNGYKGKFTNLKKDVATFNSNIKEMNLSFIKSKSEFGIYSFRKYLSDLSTNLNLNSRVNDTKRSVGNKFYFAHDVSVKFAYNNKKEFAYIVSKLEDTYYHEFLNAEYSNGSITLNYRYFGKE